MAAGKILRGPRVDDGPVDAVVRTAECPTIGIAVVGIVGRGNGVTIQSVPGSPIEADFIVGPFGNEGEPLGVGVVIESFGWFLRSGGASSGVDRHIQDAILIDVGQVEADQPAGKQSPVGDVDDFFLPSHVVADADPRSGRLPGTGVEAGERPRRGLAHSRCVESAIGGNQHLSGTTLVDQRELDAIGQQAIAHIPNLRGELWRIGMDDLLVGIGEGQEFPIGAEGEVGMHVSRRVDVILHILARSEHQQILPRAEHSLRLIGDRPLVEVVGIVGQIPTRQIDRLGSRIPNLDPVARVAIPIFDRISVARHELGDQGSRREGEARFEQLEAALVPAGSSRSFRLMSKAAKSAVSSHRACLFPNFQKRVDRPGG